MSLENDLVRPRPRSSRTTSATSSQSSSPPSGTRTRSAPASDKINSPGRPDEVKGFLVLGRTEQGGERRAFHLSSQRANAPTDWVACVVPHYRDPERPRRASVGLLCAGHHLAVERHLAELPALLTDVEAALLRGGSGGGPKVTGTPEHPLPFLEPVSDALRASRGLVASWCLLVLEEHPDGLHSPADDLRAMSRFLLRWLDDWISAQPWVDDFVREMRENGADLRRVLTFSRTRAVPLGPCERPLTCDLDTHAEQACPGTLTAVVHTLDDGLPSAITCPECGDRHEPEHWRALAKRLRKGDEMWLTYAQLSQLFRVPIGTLKYWAHEDGWRRVDGRPSRYHADDAQRGYDRRAA